MDTFVLVAAILLMLAGIAGSFLPVIPGIPLVFLSILGYGWYEGFHVISVRYLAIMGGLTMLSVLVDYLAGVWGAQQAGSSKIGMIGALVGALLGITMGPVGILIGPWIGAFLGEFYMLRDAEHAVKVATGTVIGFFAGALVKVLVGLSMLISFIVVIW